MFPEAHHIYKTLTLVDSQLKVSAKKIEFLGNFGCGKIPTSFFEHRITKACHQVGRLKPGSCFKNEINFYHILSSGIDEINRNSIRKKTAFGFHQVDVFNRVDGGLYRAIQHVLFFSNVMENRTVFGPENMLRHFLNLFGSD